MKRKIVILIGIFLALFITTCNATQDNNIEAYNQVIEAQQEELNISTFLREAKEYTQEVYEEIDFQDLLNEAIAGNIDKSKMVRSIWNIVGREILSSIKILR